MIVAHSATPGSELYEHCIGFDRVLITAELDELIRNLTINIRSNLNKSTVNLIFNYRSNVLGSEFNSQTTSKAPTENIIMMPQQHQRQQHFSAYPVSVFPCR
jgi:hypothetical protein